MLLIVVHTVQTQPVWTPSSRGGGTTHRWCPSQGALTVFSPPEHLSNVRPGNPPDDTPLYSNRTREYASNKARSWEESAHRAPATVQAESTMERWSSLLGCHTLLLLWIHILNWLTTVGTAQRRGGEGGGGQVKPHLCWFSDASGMIISSALPEPTHRLALTCLYCILNVQIHPEEEERASVQASVCEGQKWTTGFLFVVIWNWLFGFELCFCILLYSLWIRNVWHSKLSWQTSMWILFLVSITYRVYTHITYISIT